MYGSEMRSLAYSIEKRKCFSPCTTAVFILFVLSENRYFFFMFSLASVRSLIRFPAIVGFCRWVWAVHIHLRPPKASVFAMIALLTRVTYGQAPAIRKFRPAHTIRYLRRACGNPRHKSYCKLSFNLIAIKKMPLVDHKSIGRSWSKSLQ